MNTYSISIKVSTGWLAISGTVRLPEVHVGDIITLPRGWEEVVGVKDVRVLARRIEGNLPDRPTELSCIKVNHLSQTLLDIVNTKAKSYE